MSFSIFKLPKLSKSIALLLIATLFLSLFSSCSTEGTVQIDSNIYVTVSDTVFLSREPEPSVSAASAILIDASNGNVLSSKSPDKRMPMASTTKIMTALVALENCDVSAVVEIPQGAVGIEGSSVYLYAGEKLTMEDLLYAMLLESANDAAAAIAIEVGGSIEGFADMMNEKAASLGLKDTHFTNPHGLDDEAHYTTARELAIIAREAMKNERFAEIVSTYKKTIPLNDTEGVRLLINHNKLLKSYDGAVGIKTGYTKKSGRCLVSAAERDGLRLICVTLSAPDDWRDHKSLFDYGFSNYSSRVLCEEGEFEQMLPVIGGEEEYVTVTNEKSVRLTLPKSADPIECTVELPRFVFAPVNDGEKVGRLLFSVNGTVICTLPLHAKYAVGEVKQSKSLWDRITSIFD